MSLDLTIAWPRVPIAVLDFETTSADPDTCAPVSVACARFENGQLAKAFSSLVHPGVEIPAEASAIHGITSEMTRNAPTLESLAPNILAIAHDAVPAGYNAQRFDRRVLHRFISGSDCMMWDPAFPCWLDVRVVIARHHFRGKGKQTLSAACKAHGVEVEAHNAESDAKATGRLLYRLYERGVIRPCSMQQLLNGCAKAFDQQEREWAEYRARKEGQHGA